MRTYIAPFWRLTISLTVVLGGGLGMAVEVLKTELFAQSMERPLVYSAEVESIIHPVSADFMIQVLEQADTSGADLVVFTLRTPGGLVDSTRLINTRIIAARTPVVVFVGPSGARASSAGFLLTIAADVAAMAPGTHIGAAHPVSGDGQKMDETMAKKAASDMAAYARSVASQRGRNVLLSEEAVTKSRSFTEEEALGATPPLIDVIATDVNDLLDKLNGREIRRFDGEAVVLRTDRATVETVSMNWRQRVLSAIAHPQIAYLLFSLGTLGLTIELWNPGGIVPGVVGGVCLLLAALAFQILPVNYVGLMLIVLGLGLFVMELQVPGFGLLATGGIVSLVFGSLILFDSPIPELRVGLGLILPVTLALGAICFFLARLALRSQKREAVTGSAGMIGESGHAITRITPGQEGRIYTHGEIWTATADEIVEEREMVCVVGVKGLTVTVRRIGSRSNDGHVAQGEL